MPKSRMIELRRKSRKLHPLHDILQNANCDFNELKELLQRENINAFNSTGRNPFHVAVINPDIELCVIDLLIERGMNVNSVTSDMQTALHLLAALPEPRIDICERLLYHGADPNAEDMKQSTPLLFAVSIERPSLKVIELLIEYGADSELINSLGHSALSLSLLNKNINYSIVNKLIGPIDHRAPELAAIRSISFLHLYLTNINCNLDIVRLLIHRGINANQRYMFKCGLGLQIYLQNPNVRSDIIKELLEHGTLRLITGLNGCSILHCALEVSNYSEILQVLLEWDSSDINSVDEDLNTPLHKAVELQKIEAISLLINYEADVNMRNNKGKTPLHLALEDSNPNSIVIEVLLDSGALLCEVTDSGCSALRTVITNYQQFPDKYEKFAKLLLKYAVKRLFEEYEIYGSAFQGYNLDVTLSSDVNFKDYGMLSNYIDSCCREIVLMKSNMVAPYLSLYDYVIHPNRKVKKIVVRDILTILICNNFPIYNNIIANQIGRIELLSSLQGIEVYTKYLPNIESRSKIKICLNLECIDNIVKHLNDRDLLSFVLAYYSPVPRVV